MLNTGSGAEVRQTEVSKALEDLHSIITLAQGELEQLGSMLQRVRTSKPKVETSPKGTLDTKKCDLASTIIGCSVTIAGMVEHMKLLQNELEL